MVQQEVEGRLQLFYWVPRAYLARFIHALNPAKEEHHCGHNLIRKLMPLVAKAKIGFLYPPSCDAPDSGEGMPFFSDLMCYEKNSYRPRPHMGLFSRG